MKFRKIVKYLDDEGFEYSFKPIEETVHIDKTKDGYLTKYLIQDESYNLDWENDNDDLFFVFYHRDFYVEKDDIITKEEVREWLNGNKIQQENDYYIFPLSALIHSGVYLKIGYGGFISDVGGWDTSIAGVVLAPKKHYKDKNEAKSCAKDYIDMINSILIGDVYCVVVEKLNNKKEVVETDVTGGYITFDYAKEYLDNLNPKLFVEA